MEYVVLNNGTRIPKAGVGTFMLEPAEAERSVFTALKNGCKLIDTANAYMNEKAVGRGMTASKVERKEIYLSTKLWPSVYAEADRGIEETLARIDTEYIDLLFLHQPVGDYIGAYHAMERAVKAGKVKSLGLSNFPKDLIQEVVQMAEIKPQVVQVEAHPYFQQSELKKYLSIMGIIMMAWYPLGHGDAGLLNEQILTELAGKYQKTNAQVLLRWHTQIGNIVIPGSKNEAHIKENMDLFDFALTEDEVAKIRALDKNTPYYTATEEALQGYLNFAPNFDRQE